MEVEEDGPLEEWTVKELKEECKTLGVLDKGKKAELIERIKEAKAAVEETTEATVEEAAVVEAAADEEAAVEEAAVEDAAVEEAVVKEAAVEETAAEEATQEPAAEETAEVEPEAMEVEEDGPLEEWTLKELKEECTTIGVSVKGKKAELIERIKEARSSAVETSKEATVEDKSVEEAAVEEATVEVAPVEEEAAVEAAVEAEAAVEEEEPEAMEVEEDGPLEEWTVKELKEECKTLGLSDKGKKTELIERIKEARASPKEAAEVTAEETAPATEAAVE